MFAVAPRRSQGRVRAMETVRRAAIILALSCCAVAAVALMGRGKKDRNGVVSLASGDVRGEDQRLHAEERGEEKQMYKHLQEEKKTGMRQLRDEARKKQLLARDKAQGALGRYDNIMRYGDERVPSAGKASADSSSRRQEQSAFFPMQGKLAKWEQQNMGHGKPQGSASEKGTADNEDVQLLADRAAHELGKILNLLKANKEVNGEGSARHKLAVAIQSDIMGLQSVEGKNGRQGQQNKIVGQLTFAHRTSQAAAHGGAKHEREDTDSRRQYPSTESIEKKLRMWEDSKRQPHARQQGSRLQRVQTIHPARLQIVQACKFPEKPGNGTN